MNDFSFFFFFFYFILVRYTDQKGRLSCRTTFRKNFPTLPSNRTPKYFVFRNVLCNFRKAYCTVHRILLRCWSHLFHLRKVVLKLAWKRLCRGRYKYFKHFFARRYSQGVIDKHQNWCETPGTDYVYNKTLFIQVTISNISLI